jgi:hypothetical protein
LIKIGGLTPEQLQQRLGGSGLRVIIGPFIFSLRTTIPAYIADFGFAYADFRSAIKTRSAISAFAWHRLLVGGRGVRRGRSSGLMALARSERFPGGSPCRMPSGASTGAFSTMLINF